MTDSLLLGIDDTDVLGQKPGTGRLARELGAHLAELRLAQLIGVVRQQLLVDPRIPYTSHNSPACVLLAAGDGAVARARIFAAATEYVQARAAAGSDPGVCLAPRAAVTAAVVAFGYRAGAEVVAKGDALDVAARAGLRLAELGGTGDGVIGALAGIGLTGDGNAGRFLEWRGALRDTGEQVQAAALRAHGIAVLCIARNGEPVPDAALIATGDRLRPRLIGGRPVLLVEPSEGGWCCFDRKMPHEHESPDDREPR